MSVPAEFRMPSFNVDPSGSSTVARESWGSTQFGNVLRPVGGSLGPLHAEFRVHREFSGADSVEQGIEVEREVEICLIRTDSKSVVPLRVGKKGERVSDSSPVLKDAIEKIAADETVPEGIRKTVIAQLTKKGVVRGEVRSELSRQQMIDLAPLYDRFKTQKSSTDTDIFKWQAITDQDRGLLASQNIFTVEQLYHTPQEQRYRLGPVADELWAASERFMKAKKRQEESKEHAAEISALREEREKQAKAHAEMEKKYFEMQERLAQLEAATKKGSKGTSIKEAA